MSVSRFIGISCLSILLSTVSFLEAKTYAEMDCSQLWYSRNALFAEAGYCFKSPAAIKVFGRVCQPPRYGRLVKEEKEELRRIRYWEHRKGCDRKKVLHAEHYGDGSYAYVKGIRPGDELTVRSGPSTRSRRIGGLPPYAKHIEIIDCVNGWCEIRYRGLRGWVSDKYLKW